MNRVTLVGRLTAKPELRYTGSNLPYARFTVAVNRNFRNNDGQTEADFISVIVWRKQAENVKNYLSQGSQVAIDGRIQTRSYDGEDGKKRYVTEVVADNVQFLDTKSSKQDGSGSDNGPTPYDFAKDDEPQTTSVKSDPFADFGSSIEINDDELPF